MKKLKGEQGNWVIGGIVEDENFQVGRRVGKDGDRAVVKGA